MLNRVFASAAQSAELVLIVNTAVATGTTFGIALTGGTGGYRIDWGDGTVQDFAAGGPTTRSRTYAAEGTYTVRIAGRVTRIGTGSAVANLNKLVEVRSFGRLPGLTSLAGAFWGASNLVAVPNRIPPGITSLDSTFRQCSIFNQDLNGWDTRSVTLFTNIFSEATLFNGQIGGWDTAAGTTMAGMFTLASAFNRDIGGWNTGLVTNMQQMFDRALAFNQFIGAWNVSQVSNMANMFNTATVFNQNLSGWCVSLIGSEPTGFATSSALTAPNKPIWGTCP
jgi:hypothetical protein